MGGERRRRPKSDPRAAGAPSRALRQTTLADEEFLARLPLERKRSSDKESRKIKRLERLLIAKVCQLLRNSL
ncbi:hypothetical protein B1812_12325 [Methylocystis bryophila]|uniref:Uncharacterized protein n=1 Tax=Methylocystis bryophila TaxID=655015 RepID=A0A1W6MVX5_9HYPH|nr:hypothetical protein B1812_12325 [Methylocystis bryophila]